MNRRKIIKSFAAIGGLALLPKAAISNFTTQKKPLHFIGIGGAGSNTVEYIFRKRIKASYTCISHPQRPHLPPGINFISFAPPQKIAFENGKAIYRISNMEEPVVIPKSVKEIFTPNERYILLAGLGGYTGTFMTVALCEYLKEKGISFSTICNYPLAFEGPHRTTIANDGLKKLEVYGYCKCFYLDDLKTQYGNLKMSEAFERLSEEVYNMCVSEIGL